MVVVDADEFKTLALKGRYPQSKPPDRFIGAVGCEDDLLYEVNSKALESVFETLHANDDAPRNISIHDCEIAPEDDIVGLLLNTRTGMKFSNCRFVGRLTISHSSLNHLIFHNCTFERGLQAVQFETRRNLYFKSCLFRSDPLRIDRPVVNLGECVIKGSMSFEGSVIENKAVDMTNDPGFPATLMLDNSHVENRFMLSNTRDRKIVGRHAVTAKRYFRANGTISLSGMHVGKQAIFDGAQLDNPKGETIIAHHMRVGGDLMMSNAFLSRGHVDLQGANIEGQFSVVKATLIGRDVDPDRAEVGGTKTFPPKTHRQELRKLRNGTKRGLSLSQPIKADEKTHPIDWLRFILTVFVVLLPIVAVIGLMTPSLQGMETFTYMWVVTPTILLVLIVWAIIWLSGRILIPSKTVDLDDRPQHKGSKGMIIRPALTLRFCRVGQDCNCYNLAYPPDGTVDLSHAKVYQFKDDTSFLPARDDRAQKRTFGYLQLDGFRYEKLSSQRDWTLVDDESYAVDYEAEHSHLLPILEGGIIRQTAEYREIWLKRQHPDFTNDRFLRQPWLQCARVLNESAETQQARRLLIKMEQAQTLGMQQARTDPGWLAIKHYIEILTRRLRGWVSNYGHSPTKPLFLIMAAMLTGGILLSAVHLEDEAIFVPSDPRYYLDESYAADTSPRDYSLNYPKFNPFIFSADRMVPIIDFRQVTHWRVKSYYPETSVYDRIRAIHYSDRPFRTMWEQLAASVRYEATNDGSEAMVPATRTLALIIDFILSVLGWFLTTIFVFGLAESSFRRFRPDV